MEMGNVSKRQQPDHRADNNRRAPMGLQWRMQQETPATGGVLQLAPKQICILVQSVIIQGQFKKISLPFE